MLNAYGFLTEEYSSAEAFLSRDGATKIDCLVLDVDFGGMSGIELQRQLRDCGSKLPVIFITALEDGWVINGPRRLEGARVSAHGDHRVAMALAVAALIADSKTEIDGAECVEISYPEFFDHLEYLC